MTDFDQTLRDISLFSDPATEVSSRREGQHLYVQLFKNGKERSYFFRSPTGPIEAKHNERVFVSLASLLASDEFADLRQFASTQRRMLSGKGLHDLIEPAGVINPGDGEVPFSLLAGEKLISPSAKGDRGDVLDMILIDGAAGVGKTSLIERLVFDRSEDASKPPILHISSKGRRLSNLPDAIGKTASDADARFRADQVPVLARLGALQIAIDGFDELVQPDGYGNAWGALKDLVRSVAPAGPLILAGRDTFFDQQDLDRRLQSFGSRIALTMVRLTEVPEHVAVEWLVGRGWRREEIDSRQVQEFFKRQYVRRPFFLSRIADLQGFDHLPTEAGSPQGILVSRLLAREADILLAGLSTATREGVEERLRQLCCELALDMADRESDSVALEYIEFTADYIFSDISNEDERSAIVKKAGSIALLEMADSGLERRFPHSEIQNYFLATAMFERIINGNGFSFLRSILLGGDVVEAFADVLRRASVNDYNLVVKDLIDIKIREKFSDRMRMNVSALLLAASARGDYEGEIDLKSSEINEVRVFDRLSPVNLTSAFINRLDARGADLSEVRFDGCHVATLQVTDATQFGKSLPDAGTLQVEGEFGQRPIHDEGAKSDWILSHSALAEDISDWERHRDLALVKYFDRVCRRFIRQHQIRDTDRDDGAYLIRDARWRVIEEILGDRVSVLTKATSGVDNIFYHVRGPEELLNPPPGTEAAAIRQRIVEVAVREEG